MEPRTVDFLLNEPRRATNRRIRVELPRFPGTIASCSTVAESSTASTRAWKTPSAICGVRIHNEPCLPEVAFMSQSTARFRFEFRILKWSEGFIGLREDGSIRRVYVSHGSLGFESMARQQLIDSYPRWFLYEPQVELECATVEWMGLSAECAERWLGEPLDGGDFQDVRHEGSLQGWPESWRVRFA